MRHFHAASRRLWGPGAGSAGAMTPVAAASLLRCGSAAAAAALLPAVRRARCGGARRPPAVQHATGGGGGGMASVGGEGGEVAGGGAGDVGADDHERLDGVAYAVDLAAAGRDARGEEAAVEGDALVAERVALVDGDDDGREAGEIGGGGEEWPGEGVAAAIGVGEGEGVEELGGEEDSVVVDGGGEGGVGPTAGDEGAHGEYALEKAVAALRLELEADSKREIAAATVTGDDDTGRVHLEGSSILM